jgi:hypothetical protein
VFKNVILAELCKRKSNTQDMKERLSLTLRVQVDGAVSVRAVQALDRNKIKL